MPHLVHLLTTDSSLSAAAPRGRRGDPSNTLPSPKHSVKRYGGSSVSWATQIQPVSCFSPKMPLHDIAQCGLIIASLFAGYVRYQPRTERQPTRPEWPTIARVLPGNTSVTVHIQTPSLGMVPSKSTRLNQARTESSERSIAVSGLRNGQRYSFVGVAVNDAGASEDSEPSAVVIPGKHRCP